MPPDVAGPLDRLAARERRTPRQQLQWVIDHYLPGWLAEELLAEPLP